MHCTSIITIILFHFIHYSQTKAQTLSHQKHYFTCSLLSYHDVISVIKRNSFLYRSRRLPKEHICMGYCTGCACNAAAPTDTTVYVILCLECEPKGKTLWNAYTHNCQGRTNRGRAGCWRTHKIPCSDLRFAGAGQCA